MFGEVVEELNRLWSQQKLSPGLMVNPDFREVWNYLFHYANERLLEKPVGTTMKIGNMLMTHIPRSISAVLEDPTIDDIVEKRGAAYTRLGGIAVTFYFVDAPTDEFRRGFVEWDISVIPNTSTITKVEFRYHGAFSTAENCWIYAMANQPSVQSDDNAGNQVIWDDAGDGTAYLSSNAVFPEVGVTKDVGGAAGPAWDTDPKADVETALGVGWFAFGYKSAELVSADTAGFLSEEYVGPPTPAPTLYLEFELPGPPTPPGSTLTDKQAVPDGSRHIETPFYPYSISLTTDRILRHVTKRVRG